MINFGFFYQKIAIGPLSIWLKTLPYQIEQWEKKQNKQSKYWKKIVDNLPKITPAHINLKTGIIAKSTVNLSSKDIEKIIQLLKKLMPWRKGPFSIYGVNINSEWRSDLKWQRIIPYISTLKNKLILDIGCGNGYYMWRMLGENAKFIVGIDPIERSLYQFEAIRKLLGNIQKIHLLPLTIEQLPALNAFDTVFSMGVIYHSRSPLEHLYKINNQLVSNGEIILESLVIEGDETQCLIPTERYAKMRNVYFIPSAKMLKIWLKKCRFYDIKIINQTPTTTQEQRKTLWMKNESLEDFLKPHNHNLTLEGYPAPIRAILIAKKM
ncbi:MAG: tRNA 5-methoxyuridine(34)/uridine 5-oxyacetic acid(34) synthase CmoB [Arsenophonus sp.]|nr:MAG: tRNA 5-methoxyuridine(34)/uridine 5-oxyacetic acid(34) synthase CmoB [Arsenophonus sp.]